jgi:amphi-Trp domain-containing protein
MSKSKQKSAKKKSAETKEPKVSLKAEKHPDNGEAEKLARKAAKKDEKKDAKHEGKSSVEFESAIQRDEAVSYFETLVAGLKKGSIHLRQNDEELTLTPPSQLEVRVKASRKREKEKISFEIHWRTAANELSISAE